MPLPIVSPMLFNAHALPADPADSHLQPGIHLRVDANPLLGLPVAPHIVWRAVLREGRQIKLHNDAVFVDSRGRVLIPAIGLIVAERDALDDRTASDVAHQLAPVISREARGAVDLGREWGERWRAYTAALAVRGSVESPATRLARVLLSGAGIAEPTAEQLVRATLFVNETRSAANVALGEGSVPAPTA